MRPAAGGPSDGKGTPLACVAIPVPAFQRVSWRRQPPSRRRRSQGHPRRQYLSSPWPSILARPTQAMEEQRRAPAQLPPAPPRVVLHWAAPSGCDAQGRLFVAAGAAGRVSSSSAGYAARRATSTPRVAVPLWRAGARGRGGTPAASSGGATVAAATDGQSRGLIPRSAFAPLLAGHPLLYGAPPQRCHPSLHCHHTLSGQWPHVHIYIRTVRVGLRRSSCVDLPTKRPQHQVGRAAVVSYPKPRSSAQTYLGAKRPPAAPATVVNSCFRGAHQWDGEGGKRE